MNTRTRNGRHRVATSRWLKVGATVTVTLGLIGSTIASASADPVEEQPRHSFAEYQGIPISIYEYGPSAEEAPTIVMTGGWPGTSDIFEASARKLASTYHVVRYDHRGSGESGHPTDTQSYTLENLAGEYGAVIDKTAPGRPIHNYGIAFGAWIAAEYQWRHPGRIVSLSSIGAPSADLVHYALADAATDPTVYPQLAFQLACIFYFAGYEVPDMPEAFFRTFPVEPVLAELMKLKGNPPMEWSNADTVSGVQMYRANTPERVVRSPRYDYLTVPVMQVFQSPDDQEGPLMIRGLAQHTNNLWLTQIQGDHGDFGRTSWPLIRAELDKAIATTEPGASTN
ncbi:alpha/beta fold hydrolase [Nocardia sp. NPDC051570]|uniref:alpha/beta fold hydrolase n=1 Tax=Nocardia sp. NPDC051570 TaxID=3364324 RepID=UPI003791A234